MPFKNNVLNDESTGIYISTGNNSFTDAQNTLLTMDGISFLSGNSGYSDVYGSSVFCGYNSGNYANSGDHATAIGMNTLSNSTGSTKCTALGYDALGCATLNDRVIAIGAQAGYNYTTTESNCIAIANMGVALDTNVIRIGTSAISASLSLSYVTGYSSGGDFGFMSQYTIEGYPYFACSARNADHNNDILKFDGSTVSLAAYSNYGNPGNGPWPSDYSWLHYQGKVYLAQSIIFSGDNTGAIVVSQFTGTTLTEVYNLGAPQNSIATSVQWFMVEGVAYLLVAIYGNTSAIYMFTGTSLVKVVDIYPSNKNVSMLFAFTLNGIVYIADLIDTDTHEIRVYSFDGTALTFINSTSYSGAIPQQTITYKNKTYWPLWNSSDTITIESFDGSSFATTTSFSASNVQQYPAWGYLNGEPILTYCDNAGTVYLMQFDGTTITQIFTQAFSGASLKRAQIFEMDGITYLALNGTSLGPSNNQTFAVYSITGTAAIPGHTSCYIAGIYGSTATSGSAVYITSDGLLGTSTSSKKYKNDIEDMPEMSHIVSSLRPVTFKFNHDGKDARTQYGLIAEEVESILPDMVLYGASGQPQDISYQFLAPILLKEIQRLNRRITALEGKCNE